MGEKKLTLEKFEEACEIVKQVTMETKLIYSDHLLHVHCNNRCRSAWSAL
mgnify:CR=1 FL=1